MRLRYRKKRPKPGGVGAFIQMMKNAGLVMVPASSLNVDHSVPWQHIRTDTANFQPVTAALITNVVVPEEEQMANISTTDQLIIFDTSGQAIDCFDLNTEIPKSTSTSTAALDRGLSTIFTHKQSN